MSSSPMVEDECEAELKDLVTEALEKKGVLSKLRAQLRASVFIALDETTSRSKDGGDQRQQPYQSDELRKAAARPAGRRSLALVRELLACLKLDYTLSVLDAELEPVAGWRQERPRLAADLGVTPAGDEPVLLALLAARGGDSSGAETPSPRTETGTDSRSAADPQPGAGTESERDAGTGADSASDDEDSFFDSLPKVRSLGAPRPTADPPPPPVRRPNGELPPLTGRGTLPPLRHGQLPSLSSAPAPAVPSESAEHSISEELELEPAGDSILSELQSDGLTDDVSINSAAELRADLMENM